MENIETFFNWLNGIVWGVPMIVLIIGTGLYLQLRLGFMPIRKVIYGFRMIWKSRTPGAAAEGEITPYAALMTGLSATIGTGNIAGVATAIAVGGPGALFWVWVTAFVGMATKYAEVVVAVKYREVDDHGEHAGGPMFAIKNGLTKRWHWLGTAFAIFGGLAGFGIGNMVQANGIASAVQNSFGVAPWISGIVMTVLTGLVVLGGIKRIGAVAEKVVPFMAIQKGVARGIFSNEAGLGTAGIAQAAGSTSNPVFSGLIGMMGTFIDTIVVCTLTGLAMMVTGVWTSGETGAVLTSSAFESAMPGFGNYLLTISLALFAFTTILGWAYYSEKCWEFLLGTVSEKPFRILWTIAVFFGATLSLDFAWLVADTLNAPMAIPNLISLLLLSPIVIKLTRDYFAPGGEGGN